MTPVKNEVWECAQSAGGSVFLCETEVRGLSVAAFGGRENQGKSISIHLISRVREHDVF